MIDFHSHILPGIDDGSASPEESEALLASLAAQGVDTVVLTPHFYPQEKTLDVFLEERDRALERLKPVLREGLPKVLVGAEVYYYQGISRMEGLNRLRLGDTKLLMLEMPMRKWSDSMIKEIIDLSCHGNMKLMLAHINRYLPMQDRGCVENLLEYGILIQANAECFLNREKVRTSLRMLKKGQIHVLGSDCHNMEERAPRLGEAVGVIRKRLGDDFTDKFLHDENRWLDLIAKKDV